MSHTPLNTKIELHANQTVEPGPRGMRLRKDGIQDAFCCKCNKDETAFFRVVTEYVQIHLHLLEVPPNSVVCNSCYQKCLHPTKVSLVLAPVAIFVGGWQRHDRYVQNPRKNRFQVSFVQQKTKLSSKSSDRLKTPTDVLHCWV